MYRRSFLLLLSTLWMVLIHAQVTDNQAGFNHFVNAQSLGDSLQIQVYLPAGYDPSNDTYPTLYLLDGQRFFLYGASLTATYQQYNLTPEFIVVGITTNYPKRFSYFSNRRDSFIAFLKTELLPLIEKTYSVSNERLLFGWEYGGSLAFHILHSDQELFDGYLLASPFPVISEVDLLTKRTFTNKSLYFSVSPDEFAVNHGVNKLDSLLSSGNINGLQWTYLKLSEEVHRSTPYPTLFHGVKQYFAYYPELQIDNLEKFLEQGSIDYALEYNQKRAQQYGFPPELSTWTKYTILRSAMRANEYHYFSQFSDTLKLDAFFRELSDSRIRDLADYLAKNSGFEQAIRFYKYLLEKYPESAILLTRIGNVLSAAGQENEAKVYLEKAAELSGN